MKPRNPGKLADLSVCSELSPCPAPWPVCPGGEQTQCQNQLRAEQQIPVLWSPYVWSPGRCVQGSELIRCVGKAGSW